MNFYKKSYIHFIFLQYMRNSCGAKCALPFSSNPQDGALGEAGIYSHPAEASHNETSTVSARQAYVSTFYQFRDHFSTLGARVNQSYQIISPKVAKKCQNQNFGKGIAHTSAIWRKITQNVCELAGK